MESHSILDLVNYCEGLEKLKLIPNYTEDEIKFVRKILQEYDPVDKNSTFFRYPIDKTQNTTKTNSRSLLRAIDDAHPVSSMKDGTYILQDKERVMYTVKDKKIVKMEYDLAKVIIILFKLNPFFSKE